ncbi:unnamed protein product [Mytilus coruscus]|uniref:Tc1-like transposase DDE domain-containing protein n=1 Tax=Mytilus coruscus TaxID=42192 RepID=A0A6J8E5T3_MYTCO|nr:unnamed protein product [Mytilus coruscus]
MNLYIDDYVEKHVVVMCHVRDDVRGVCTYVVANVNKMGRKGKELTFDQKSRFAALNDAGYRKSDIVKWAGIKQSTCLEKGWRRVADDCICPPSQRKYSLMIWGCITYHGVGTITVVDGNINAIKYIDIIYNNLWPVVVRHFPDNNYVFQDDNAPVHRARSVQDFRRETGLKSMNWPDQSPDLNIIENCWWVLKRELQKRAQNINKTKDLERAIRDIWDKLTVTYLKSLHNSIPRRILRVMRNKGNITKH